MSIIQIVEQNHILVVDSRLIATDLGIQHESFRELLEDHQVKLEVKFGVFRFETGKPPKGSRGGRPEKFYWLTELQSTAMLTLVSNTDRAVDLKLDLVEKFDTAKKLLKTVGNKQRSQYDLTLSELVRLALALEVDNHEDRKIVLTGIEIEFWDLPKDANTRLRNLILLENLAETVEIRSKLEAKNMTSQSSLKQKGFGGPSRSQMYDAILEVCLKENFAELKLTQDQANNSLSIKACEKFEEVIATRRIEAAKQALLAE